MSKYVFPETAEAHLPLQLDKNKEIIHVKESTDNHNIENIGPPLDQPIPSHLNGSIKMPAEESSENRSDFKENSQADDKHNLWKWPAGRSKFTQVLHHISNKLF